MHGCTRYFPLSSRMSKNNNLLMMVIWNYVIQWAGGTFTCQALREAQLLLLQLEQHPQRSKQLKQTMVAAGGVSHSLLSIALSNLSPLKFHASGYIPETNVWVSQSQNSGDLWSIGFLTMMLVNWRCPHAAFGAPPGIVVALLAPGETTGPSWPTELYRCNPCVASCEDLWSK